MSFHVEPTPELLRDHLSMMVHSHDCKKKEVENRQLAEQDLPPAHMECDNHQCEDTKALLEHLDACGEGVYCEYPNCQPSRQILAHYKHCVQSGCEVCPPTPPTSERNNEAPFVITELGAPQTWRDILQQSTRNQFVGRLASVIPLDRQCSITDPDTIKYAARTARLRETHIFNTAGTREMYFSMMEAYIENPTNDPPRRQINRAWQRTIKAQDRAQYVAYLIQVMLSDGFSDDKKMGNLYLCAKAFENIEFDAAFSREDYIHKIRAKGFLIQEDRRRQELLSAHPTPPTSSPPSH